MEKGREVSRREELIERVRSSGILPAGVDPADAVSAVMCTLLARINRGEAIDLLNSLPKDVCSLFERCATHRRGDHGFSFDADQFFRIVGEHLRISADRAEDLSRVVFQALHDWIPEKEFKDVDAELPRDMKAVWRAA